ncbi:hypothetical protein Efla_000582 [Eimeria flavescens]
MSACLGPRSLLVGGGKKGFVSLRLCFGEIKQYPFLFSSSFSVSAAEPPSFSGAFHCFSRCGGSTAGVASLAGGEPSVYRHPKSATISVLILGGSDCKLCASAAFSVRRIVAAVSARGDSAGFPHLQLQRRGTDCPAASKFRCTDTSANGGRGASALPSRAAAASEGSSQSSTPSCEAAASSRGEEEALAGTRRGVQTAGGFVTVEVEELNLDSPSAWRRLGLTQTEAEALRSQVPLVFVEGKEAAFRITLCQAADYKQKKKADEGGKDKTKRK